MFSALKRLFSRSPESKPAPQLTVLPTAENTLSEEDQPPAPIAVAVPRPDTMAVGTDPLQIPFVAIIQQVPSEYCGKLAPAGVAGCNFTIPKSEVLEQLPRGAVKVPLAKLKQMVPQGVFADTKEHDDKLVDLPLSYILGQLYPQDYTSRATRQEVDIPEGISDLFGVEGKSNTQIRLLKKSEVTQIPAAPSPAPTPLPSPDPAASAVPPSGQPESGSAATAPMSGYSTNPVTPVPAGVPASCPVAAPAFTPSNVSSSASGKKLFLVPLDEVATDWPEAIRQEIAQLKIPSAQCGLPSPEVCEGLKRGKLQYAWGHLRAAIVPIPPPGVSPNAETVLDLPLSILTPIFLDYIRSTSATKKPIDSERVTEFFRKSGRDVPPPAPAAEPLSSIPSHPFGTGAAPAPSPLQPAQPVAESGSANALPPISMTAPADMPPPPIAIASATAPAPPSALASASGMHAVMPAQSSGANSGTLSLPLNLVSGSWPEPVQKEIAQLSLATARVEIPFTVIEPMLRQGKIEFLWGHICSWLTPSIPTTHVSPHGKARVSLPLPVVAPLFLQQKIKKLKSRTAEVPEGIPDLFSNSETTQTATSISQTDPALAPSSQSGDTTATSHTQTSFRSGKTSQLTKPAKNLAEMFGEPNKRKWTPNDIVQKTAQLPGVAGVLIALQDGLLVAHSMPTEVKADTISAFLPQVMGRMSQYAKEFRMGKLNSITLSIDRGILQIYNPGAIYFAAFGRPGESLPVDKLDFIASELSRHGK